jgi:hypothetical protein
MGESLDAGGGAWDSCSFIDRIAGVPVLGTNLLAGAIHYVRERAA